MSNSLYQPTLLDNTIYTKVVEQASDAILITNTDFDDFQIQYVNHAFTHITGYTSEDVIGRSPALLHGKKIQADWLSKVKRNLLDGEDFLGEAINYKKNGEPCINEWRISVVKNDAGEVLHFMAIIRDISDKEGLKYALKESEKKLRATIESIAEGLILQNKSGEIIDSNRSAREILGLSKKELKEHNFQNAGWEVIDEEGQTFPEENYPITRSRLRGEEVNRELLGLIKPDKTFLWLSVSSRPIFDSDGEITGAVSSFQEVTAERSFRLSLEKLKERYHSLFELNPNPILVTAESSGKILDANESALSFYGHTIGVLKTMAMEDLKANVDVDLHKNNKFEDQIHKSKNGIVHVSIRSRSIDYDDEKARIHIINNISERKEMEFKLRQSQQQLQALTDNNPIAVYATNADGIFTIAHGSLLDKIGVPSNQLLGKSIDEVSEQYNLGLKPIKSTLTSGKEDSIVFEWGNFFLRSVRTPLKNKKGEVIGMVGVTTDFTEQYMVQTKLEKTANELSKAQQMARIGSWRFVLSTQEVVWSSITKCIHGVDFGYMPGADDLIKHYHKNDRKMVREALEKLIKVQTPYDLEVRIITASGNERWVRTMADVNLKDREPVEVYGTIQDIHQNKLNDRDRDKLEQIVKHTTNEVYIYNPETLKLDYINKSALKNLGYNEKEAEKLGLAHIVAGYNNVRFKKEVLRLLDKGSTKGKSLTCQYVRKDQSLYDVESTVQLMPLLDEQVVVIIASDVTVKKRDKKRRNLINVVNEVIVSNDDIDTGLRELIAVISDELQYDGGEFWQFNPNGEFEQKAQWGKNAMIKQFLKVSGNSKLSSSSTGIIDEIVNSDEVLFWDKLSKNQFRDITRRNIASIKSVIGFRLIIDEKLCGVLLLYGTRPNSESLEFKNTLVIVAGQIAQFLHRKKIQEDLAKSVKEKEILLREIHHRVKNNLQTVSSLLYFKSGDIQDPSLSKFFRNTQNRISAISLTHERLLKAHEFKLLDIKPYLEELIRNVYHTYHSEQLDLSLESHIIAIELPTDIVMNLGLIVNELLTNSLLHAFKGREAGKIKIDFSKYKDNFKLTIADDGVGLSSKLPRSSIGMQLVDIFVSQMHGQLKRQNGHGTKFEIRFKLKKDELQDTDS